ncbi:serine hydrolase domain-containing protein [Actinoallomurus sp. CA-142502]|uniref:serine hydrolase domain-containing protein n=1 Tax=Actinoallomurus sp. CA-142502 TaxID=3239885 RepID=UPI003D8CC288
MAMRTRERRLGRRAIVVLAVGAAAVGVVPASARADHRECGGHAATHRVLERMTHRHGLTGAAVRVDDPGCGAWTDASGVADRRTGRPMRADLRGRIGSITKSFTAVTVLALAAEGRISLDAPVERYLPGLLDRDGYDGRRVTVRSLLRHTSGLPDHMDTFYWPGDELGIRGPHPRGYVREERGGQAEWADTTAMNTTVAWAGGALISSPRDVSTFYGALLGGRLLPAAMLAEMERAVPGDPDRLWPGAEYGLGLIRTPLRCGGVWWGHAGDIDGFTAISGVAPSGRRVAIAFNENPSTQEAFDDELNLIQTALCDS